MNYRQTTTLYLGAALYRIRLERHCRRNHEWVIGTYTLLYLELKEYMPDVATFDVYAVLRYQQIVEVACAYFIEQPDGEQIRDIFELVRTAIRKAAKQLKSLSRDEVATHLEEIRVLFLASDKMHSDLKQIYSGA